MSTAPTLTNRPGLNIRIALRGFANKIRTRLQKRQPGVHPRYERRYRMRHEDLLESSLNAEIRRAWWL